MFSWAEFMAEEPVTPKGRGRKAQAATLSMFEWAFSLEREREAEPVGARPSVLIVLRYDIAVTHFLWVAREEVDRTRVEIPVNVCHVAALDDLGPLGLAWRILTRGSRKVLAQC